MIYVTIEDYFNIYVKLLQIKLNILTINKKINCLEIELDPTILINMSENE